MEANKSDIADAYMMPGTLVRLFSHAHGPHENGEAFKLKPDCCSDALIVVAADGAVLPRTRGIAPRPASSKSRLF
ncbi:hypothetical protein M413DRAFT_440135, partial [Hebeloma cylindrosporum]